MSKYIGRGFGLNRHVANHDIYESKILSEANTQYYGNKGFRPKRDPAFSQNASSSAFSIRERSNNLNRLDVEHTDTKIPRAAVDKQNLQRRMRGLSKGSHQLDIASDFQKQIYNSSRDKQFQDTQGDRNNRGQFLGKTTGLGFYEYFEKQLPAEWIQMVEEGETTTDLLNEIIENMYQRGPIDFSFKDSREFVQLYQLGSRRK